MLNQNQGRIAVINSTKALLDTYAQKNDLANIAPAVTDIIQDESQGFLARVERLDKAIDESKGYEMLNDLLFDLLMVHYLAAEEHKESYFDSAEWNEIENKTLDRGSEMLNLFLYISEANADNVEISLEDFLNEFLLVGEDEFQDEYRIYESLIENDDLLDAELDELRKVRDRIKDDTGLKEYFVPLVLYFQCAAGSISRDELPGGLDAFELSTLEALLAFTLATEPGAGA